MNLQTLTLKSITGATHRAQAQAARSGAYRDANRLAFDLDRLLHRRGRDRTRVSCPQVVAFRRL